MEINRLKAVSVIRATRGHIFSAVFVKRDGSIRKMTCRLGVKKFLKGGENKVATADSPFLIVFDMQKKEYRHLNLATLMELKASKTDFTISDRT